MTAEEKSAALELLRDPRLLQRIVADFERCGVVGEETNKLVGYLAAVSRQLESPLAVIVQSSSAAGKSSLMEAVLELMPDEQRVQLLGHDRTVAVLHGRNRSEEQSAGHRGRRRRAARRLCAEAAAIGRRSSLSPRPAKTRTAGGW